MSTNPGFRRQTGTRTAFRVAGLILAPVGLILLAVGFYRFVTYDPGFDDTGLPPGFLMFALGVIVAPVGFACLNAGFLGAAARYGAGETMPVVKDSAAYLSDGQGILGVGRTAGATSPAGAETRTGPFCTKCGVRNDADARFCDSCGNGLG